MGAIVNSGTVNAMNAAINISSAPNAIAINQTQTAGALNGDVVLSPFADVLTVSGCAINGDIVGQGPNIVNFALGDGSFTYGPTYAISAVDQINVNSGFVTLNGVNDADNVTVNGGTLAVGDAANSAAMLTAATGLTVGPGGTLMGFGTVIGNVGIASGATLSPGGSIGTMNVTGNLTIANGSFYVVEVNPAGDADRTIAGGTVQVVQPPGAYPLPIQYTILTANGGVNGTFTGATSELAFFAPELTYDPFNVYLTLTRNAVYFATVARTSNHRSVGRALDASPEIASWCNCSRRRPPKGRGRRTTLSPARSMPPCRACCWTIAAICATPCWAACASSPMPMGPRAASPRSALVARSPTSPAAPRSAPRPRTSPSARCRKTCRCSPRG
jgi:hypothetical protein